MRRIFTLCLFGSFSGMVFFLYQNDFAMFLVFLSVMPVVLMLNHFNNNRFVYVKKLRTTKLTAVSIKKIKYSPKETISKLIIESPILKNIYNFSIQNHINTFEKSGTIVNSEKIAINTINGVAVSLIFSIISIAVLYQFYQSMLLLAILLVPVMVYVQTSILHIKEKISHRKKIS